MSMPKRTFGDSKRTPGNEIISWVLWSSLNWKSWKKCLHFPLPVTLPYHSVPNSLSFLLSSDSNRLRRSLKAYWIILNYFGNVFKCSLKSHWKCPLLYCQQCFHSLLQKYSLRWEIRWNSKGSPLFRCRHCKITFFGLKSQGLLTQQTLRAYWKCYRFVKQAKTKVLFFASLKNYTLLEM